ncbi:MAG: sigma factor, partial [Candidatus Acidiferrales bacterium]
MNKRQNEFESVAMPHSRGLLRVARRLTFDPAIAEDIVQETLLRAWRGFDRFQAGTNARAWLFRILFNVFYAQARKSRSAPLLVPLQPPDREAPPAHSATDFSLLDGAVLG